MMIRYLTIILVAQLLVTAALYWPEQSESVGRDALLQGVAPEQVKSLTIEAGDDEPASIRLRREDGAWQLASGLPADENKVTTLLDALLASTPGYAIASSAAAARRFEVTEEVFERRLTVSDGDGDYRVFLGSSPSFRKVHARVDGEEDIHVLTFNSYDAPANESGWLDRGLLATQDISRLTINGSSFRLADDGWLADSDGESAADLSTLPSIVSRLSGLQVTGVVDPEEATPVLASEPALTLDFDSSTAGTGSLAVFSDDDRYFLRGSRYEGLFSTSSYDAEGLIEAVQKLNGTEEPVEDSADEQGMAAPNNLTQEVPLALPESNPEDGDPNNGN